MKHSILLLILGCAAVAARGVEVEILPASKYADTEVSTNFPFSVSFERKNRIEVTLAMDAMPSNNVEVVLGTDANGDGNLSPEEAAYALGYDCGRWFTSRRDQGSGTMDEVEAESGRRLERTFILKKRQISEVWNLAKVTRRGLAPSAEWVNVKAVRYGFRLEIR